MKKGKDLNQELLTRLAHEMNVLGEHGSELLTQFQDKTITEIITEALWFANDMYQADIFDKTDLVIINDIIVKLRKSSN